MGNSKEKGSFEPFFTSTQWTGLDWTGLDWTGLGLVIALSLSACKTSDTNPVDTFFSSEISSLSQNTTTESSDTSLGSIGNAALSFTPTTYGFDTTLTTSSSSTTVTLKNITTDYRAYISDVSISSTHFTVLANGCAASPTAIAPGASCSITVRFNPTIGGSHAATLLRC